LQSKTKHGGIGMLGLEVQDKAWSGLLALPLKFTGHVHSSVHHALKAVGKEV
jgi:hypothetical protein